VVFFAFHAGLLDTFFDFVIITAVFINKHIFKDRIEGG